MQSAARKQAREFAGLIDAIADDRVRYFYLMLGEALAAHTAARAGLVNTGPGHVAAIAARLNGH